MGAIVHIKNPHMTGGTVVCHNLSHRGGLGGTGIVGIVGIVSLLVLCMRPFDYILIHFLVPPPPQALGPLDHPPSPSHLNCIFYIHPCGLSRLPASLIPELLPFNL